MTDVTPMIEALNEYKTLTITQKQLRERLGMKFKGVYLEKDQIVIVDNNDLIFALQSVKQGRLSVPDLVEWVNMIWLSDLYDYFNEHSHAMTSVMNSLEELDETGFYLPAEQIDKYIAALEKNEEYQ